MSKAGDIIEIPGIKGKIKLFECQKCRALIGLENLETDREKPARWKKWNLDGTVHQDSTSYRTQKAKIWPSYTKKVYTADGEIIFGLTEEFEKDGISYEKAFAQVKDAVEVEITKALKQK